jgi:glutamyl-tRNA synthetase
MLSEGKAYRCYCSREELDEKRAKAMADGRKPKYDGSCRELKEQPEGKPFTIRFKAPLSGTTLVDDMIKGKVAFDNQELDDLVIARSDGSPTYNFVVVVDDATMGITHIMRGDDHLNNTPRQIQIFEALGFEPPRFGHMPLILGQDKKRLSKRHGATAVTAYGEMGYLPHALVNYLARLGWSHGDQEIFSTEDLIKYFDPKDVGKSAGVFNSEKLLWLNAHYIKETTDEELAGMITPLVEADRCVLTDGPPLKEVIHQLKERAKTLTELAEMAKTYYEEDVTFDEKAADKFLTNESAEILKNIAEGIEELEEINEETLDPLFKKIMEEKDLKMGKIAQPARVALTGGTVSPGIFEVITLLGKKKSVRRIIKALERI